MKLTTLLVMVLGIASVILACTSAVSAVPFDGESDVDISDHTGATSFGVSVASAGDLNNDGYTDLVIGARGANKAFVYYSYFVTLQANQQRAVARPQTVWKTKPTPSA
ncbi:MAG: hypothetical protein C4B59_05925 [Candidatus Methanogaster sp.]|uniref:Uncharacterized protein n=1 Tax=Candidatus Methanogaster sp. TaxID=3386292 RepID=A0AC61L4A3_9EURY|nr:MAG: hypothetical protein C4B59_05925 [ANME-2 cluster archaeon]